MLLGPPIRVLASWAVLQYVPEIAGKHTAKGNTKGWEREINYKRIIQIPRAWFSLSLITQPCLFNPGHLII